MPAEQLHVLAGWFVQPCWPMLLAYGCCFVHSKMEAVTPCSCWHTRPAAPCRSLPGTAAVPRPHCLLAARRPLPHRVWIDGGTQRLWPAAQCIPIGMGAGLARGLPMVDGPGAHGNRRRHGAGNGAGGVPPLPLRSAGGQPGRPARGSAVDRGCQHSVESAGSACQAPH